MYDDKQLLGHPVGTGPFRLADWRRSSRMVLERNPGYRDDVYEPQPTAGDAVGEAMAAQLRGRKLPLVDRVEVYIVEENQPRWLAFLNAEHDLVDELPYDFANLVIPNGQLAPNLQRRSIQMDRAPRANVDMALLQHGAPGGRRLHAREGRAAPRDRARLRGRRRDPPGAQGPVDSVAVAGRRRSTAGYDPAFRSEMSEYSPARAQGAARHVRLRRPRRRRLARTARRLAAEARNGDPAGPAVAPARRDLEAEHDRGRPADRLQAGQVAREPEELPRGQADDVARRLGGRAAGRRHVPRARLRTEQGPGQPRPLRPAGLQPALRAAANAARRRRARRPVPRGEAAVRRLRAVQVPRPPHRDGRLSSVGDRLPAASVHARLLEVHRHRPRSTAGLGPPT